MEEKKPKHREDKKQVKGKQTETPQIKDKNLEGVRLIVRLASRDLDGSLPIYRSLERIKGIGSRIARMVAYAFENKTSIKYDSLLGKIPEDKAKVLEEIVINPLANGIPEWGVNRQKDFSSGQHLHKTMADLDFALREDIKRLGEIKSYKGLRHAWRLPVRGQRTKSTHRGKGSIVGVLKKENIQAQKAAGKTEEKKK